MKNKFTLIELLAVIGIIGILFTLVLTTGPKVLAIAKLRTCTSNLRQLGLAATAYANRDSRSRLPGPCPRARFEDSHGNVAGGNDLTSWDKALATQMGIENRPKNYYHTNVVKDFGAETGKMTYYTKALNVFTCPIDPIYAKTESAEGIVRSYLLNIGDDEINPKGDAIFVGRISNPSDTALFVESHSPGKGNTYKYFGSPNEEGGTYVTVKTIGRYIHEGENDYIMHGSNGMPTFNICCFDGSTRLITVRDLMQDKYRILRHKK